MTKKMEIYKCELCGNIVEMVHGGKGDLVCCGEPMVRYEENTTDAAVEKHVPVVEESCCGGGVNVKVGSVAHPMEEEHYIEWIELIDGDKSCREFLQPGDAPEATLCAASAGATARAYCNVHGLWRS